MTEQAEMIYKLFKQAQNQQEINFDGKTPQEKVELIKNMFENMSEDHPLRINIK